MVPGNFNLKPGEEYPMTFVTGSLKGLLLWADTSLKDDAHGITNEDPQALRIAILDAAGNTLETTRHEKVGRKLGDKPWPRLDIKFQNPAKTASVIITREDAGTKTVSFCLY